MRTAHRQPLAEMREEGGRFSTGRGHRFAVCSALVLWGLLTPLRSWAQPAAGGAPPTGGSVLLVVNDASEDSKTIGAYYAAKRSLPPENVCHIHTKAAENIDRNTFRTEVYEPVAACLSERSLEDKIQFIVTTKGIPLTVLGDAGPVGDLAALDSELALLYSYLAYGPLQTFGRIENPYFVPTFETSRVRPFKSADYGVYLVTRLTGWSTVDVIFLIDRGSNAKPEGGFLLDLPSSRETTESEWFDETAKRLQEMKRSVLIERSAAPLEDPRPTLGYCSLGAADPNFDPAAKINWSPGAIAIAMDQTAASSFNGAADNEKGREEWGARCVATGVTGFGGHVADPTLDGQIRPQIVFPAYASGYNLAESFYQGIRYLSWREVVVGDPLAAPLGDNLGAQRRSHPIPAKVELDPETGLPTEFSKRREQFLVERFSTTVEAVRPLLKAEALRNQGRLSEAVPWLSRSVSIDPELVASHLLLGRAFEVTGEFRSAFDQYKKAIDLGDSDPETYQRLATLARDRLKDPTLAEPYARWLLEHLGAAQPDVLRLWADVQFDLGNLDQAELYYAKLAKETQPPMVAAFVGLGKIQSRKGNWEQAKAFFESALQRLDSTPSAGTPKDSEPNRGELEDLLAACERQLQSGAGTVEESSAEAEPEAGEPGPETEIQPARVLSKVLPDYPSSAKEAGLEGTVVMRLLIDERGQLVKVKRVYGDETLAKAFEKALSQWKFAPRLVRGVPEPSWLTVPLRFRLQKNKP